MEGNSLTYYRQETATDQCVEAILTSGEQLLTSGKQLLTRGPMPSKPVVDSLAKRRRLESGNQKNETATDQKWFTLSGHCEDSSCQPVSDSWAMRGNIELDQQRDVNDRHGRPLAKKYKKRWYQRWCAENGKELEIPFDFFEWDWEELIGFLKAETP